MADEPRLGPEEIERLLKQAQVALPLSNLAAPAGAGPGMAAESKAGSSSRTKSAGNGLSQGEIESLFQQVNPAVPGQSASEAAGPAGAPRDAGLAQADIELLLKQAEQALASIENPGGDPPPGATAYQLEDFVGASANGERATLDLIRDVELDLRIEFGRTHMYLEDILKLRKGSVVPLDKLAGDPVDIFVNGRLIAKGEVLVLNDNFCVRVAELVAGNTVAA